MVISFAHDEQASHLPRQQPENAGTHHYVPVITDGFLDGWKRWLLSEVQFRPEPASGTPHKRCRIFSTARFRRAQIINSGRCGQR
jgi:hypothetical protein